MLIFVYQSIKLRVQETNPELFYDLPKNGEG